MTFVVFEETWKIISCLKCVCFLFFRRFWVQIGDRSRADIVAHPGSACHHCTLHTTLCTLRFAHYIERCKLRCTALSSLHSKNATLYTSNGTLHTVDQLVITAHWKQCTALLSLHTAHYTLQTTLNNANCNALHCHHCTLDRVVGASNFQIA